VVWSADRHEPGIQCSAWRTALAPWMPPSDVAHGPWRPRQRQPVGAKRTRPNLCAPMPALPPRTGPLQPVRMVTRRRGDYHVARYSARPGFIKIARSSRDDPELPRSHVLKLPRSYDRRPVRLCPKPSQSVEVGVNIHRRRRAYCVGTHTADCPRAPRRPVAIVLISCWNARGISGRDHRRRDLGMLSRSATSPATRRLRVLAAGWP